MTEKANKVMRDLVAAISSHDAEKVASYFTEDCIYEDVALGSVMHGREKVKAAYADFYATVPDFKLEMVLLFIAGNWVGSEWIMTGTSTTGKSFSTRGASVSEVQRDKIKRNRHRAIGAVVIGLRGQNGHAFFDRLDQLDELREVTVMSSFGFNLLPLSATRLPVSVRIWSSSFLAFGSAAIVGIFFDFYPANRAVQSDPIEALRYE